MQLHHVICILHLAADGLRASPSGLILKMIAESAMVASREPHSSQHRVVRILQLRFQFVRRRVDGTPTGAVLLTSCGNAAAAAILKTALGLLSSMPLTIVSLSNGLKSRPALTSVSDSQWARRFGLLLALQHSSKKLTKASRYR